MKIRADQLLVNKGLVSGRDRAKTTIMSGLVYVGEVRIDKPGQLLSEDAEIIVRGEPNKFVSRGGLKLEKALNVFKTDVNGLKIIDVGASSGGFTDCLLRRGAAHVWAVDVGYGQLAWSLRKDERVTVLERTNIRYVTPDKIGQALDMAVIDVSFISLKLVLPPVRLLLKSDCKVMCLVKPQFEAGRESVGKKGVVRSPSVHEQVIEQFAEYAKASGLEAHGLTYSPIRGPEGNIEYLALLSSAKACEVPQINQIVEEAHLCL
jgi:23S rRNA (cytidine1920-2'-O)/16S rRNA (cytidine1409-2'-O)-methyltransferase